MKNTSPQINPRTKRRYNLVYRARVKGYRVSTPGRTLWRPPKYDKRLEGELAKFGFHVQTEIFNESFTSPAHRPVGT